MKTWFKFYGQEYLSDPKMLSLTPIEKSLWLTILCLTASSNVEGEIHHIDEWKIMTLTGINPIDKEWNDNVGFLQKFISLQMITHDNATIKIVNFNKRQNANLSGYERVKRYRKIHKIEAKNDNANDNVHDNANDNVREEKNRIDKNRKEERVYTSQKYLENLPDGDVKEFKETYNCSTAQIIGKSDDLLNYCKSKGKKYSDYKAFLRNALKRDFGLRPASQEFKPDLPDKPISEEKLSQLRMQREKLLGGNSSIGAKL